MFVGEVPMEPEEYRSAELDRCDFIDVLEEAAIFGGPVQVRLTDGQAFEDVVGDVITEGGREMVRFKGRGKVPLAEIEAATRGVRIERT